MNAWDELIKHVSGGLIDDDLFLHGWIERLICGEIESQPYLRLVGPPGSGHSSFHEALAMLATVTPVNEALRNDSGFNSELANTHVAVIEEFDWGHDVAYSRIHKWVTQPEIAIHQSMRVPTRLTNTLRWVECASRERSFKFPVRTFHLQPLDYVITKRKLMRALLRDLQPFLKSLRHGNCTAGVSNLR